MKDITAFQHKNTVTWLNVDGLPNESIMEEITRVFNLDTLVMAEVLNTEARPRTNRKSAAHNFNIQNQ